RGLGRALAGELAGRGWAVVVDARDAAALQRTASDLGGRITRVAGDVADPGHRAQLARAVARFGRLDLLVNNASELGPSPQPALDRYSLEDMERVVRVNVLAPLSLIQLVLPHLASASGMVINVTSDAAVEPYPGWGGY